MRREPMFLRGALSPCKNALDALLSALVDDFQPFLLFVAALMKVGEQL
jgi:hypothetical protein